MAKVHTALCAGCLNKVWCQSCVLTTRVTDALIMRNYYTY